MICRKDNEYLSAQIKQIREQDNSFGRMMKLKERIDELEFELSMAKNETETS